MGKLSYNCSNLTIDVLAKKFGVNINYMTDEVVVINGDVYISRLIETRLTLPKRLDFTVNYYNPNTSMIEKGDYPTEKLFDHFQHMAAVSEDQIVEHVLRNIPYNIYKHNVLNLYKITAYCTQKSTSSYVMEIRLQAGIIVPKRY